MKDSATHSDGKVLKQLMTAGRSIRFVELQQPRTPLVAHSPPTLPGESYIQIIRARQRLPASIQTVAAVAARVHAFRDELGRAVEGVIGPSQWEADVSHPTDIGPRLSGLCGIFGSILDASQNTPPPAVSPWV